jgi:hypothetical protein
LSAFEFVNERAGLAKAKYLRTPAASIETGRQCDESSLRAADIEVSNDKRHRDWLGRPRLQRG